MKTIFVGLAFLVGSAVVSFPARADFESVESLDSCDQLYSLRGANLPASVECYEKLRVELPLDQRESVYERQFIALSAMVNDSPKTQTEVDAIRKAMELLGRYSREVSESAGLFYWRAVFVSFDAMQKDRGQALPRTLFGVLRSIQDDLRKAISLNAPLHSHGPARVLGTMHTQMPAIVGGDKSLAEKTLLDALKGSPSMCANHLAYAKILQVNGKKNEARTVLNRFLSMSDRELDPYPEEPLRNLKPEIERDRKAARDLLARLGG